MRKRLFHREPKGLTVAEIAALTGAVPRPGASLDRVISDVNALDRAGPSDLAFLDSPKYAGELPLTRAGACLTTGRFEGAAPTSVAVLRSNEPFQAFVAVARALYPDAVRPSSLFEAEGRAPEAVVHSSARIEYGVTIEPGAVIGPRAGIGAGTVIGSTAVIGADVQIGRNCSIGPGSTVMHALIGDGVVLHPGCRIGQDGFRYQPGAKGHTKVPQLGW